MINLFINYFLLFLVRSNIVLCSGVGTTLFQKEKESIKFRLISTGYLMIGIILCTFVCYALNRFVFVSEALVAFKITIYVLVVSIYQLIEQKLFSKFSKLNFYLYQKSNEFVVDFAFIIYLVNFVDYSLNLLEFTFVIVSIIFAVLLTVVFVGFFIQETTKSSVKKSYITVSSRLFIIAIFTILLSYLTMIL